MQNPYIERFWNEISDGQDLFHHRTKWSFIFSKIIALFGKIGNPRMLMVSHTSTIINVERFPNKVEFQLLEATKKRGVNISTRRQVYKIGSQYSLGGFHKDEKLYWSPDIKPNNDTLKKLETFQKAVVGKKYTSIFFLRKAYTTRILKCLNTVVEWFFATKITDINFEIKELKNIDAFYCSQLNRRKDYEIGVISENDFADNPYTDPMSFARTKKEVLRVK